MVQGEGLFFNKSFLILPNCRSSSLRFLSQLIKENGGQLIDNTSNTEKSLIVLINDTFVDSDQKLRNIELFEKELESDSRDLWKFIFEERPPCVKASCISEWLRVGKIDVSKGCQVRLEELNVIDDSQIGAKQDRTDRKATSEEDPDESMSETDIGSHTSSDESTDTVKRLPARKLPSQSLATKESSARFVGEKHSSHNELLVKAFSRLAKRYEIKGDQFRTRGYKLARIGIERYPSEILSGEQARQEIASVGPSIARKIQIILDTGSLPGLDESFDLEKRLNYYTQCHNVGIYSAKRWNLLDLRTFSDVSKKFPEVFLRDWAILFGWSYYEDWLKKISRAECEAVLKVVEENLRQIDPEMTVELQGSYVRGALECGDIDLLFFKKNSDDTSRIGRVMEKLALRLYDIGYIKCFLQLTTKIQRVFGQKILERISKCELGTSLGNDYPPSVEKLKKFYLGFKLGSEFKPDYLKVEDKAYTLLDPADQFMSFNSVDRPCRRVDFFCCKWSELGAARLQWTGPKEFNRWIRIRAAQKGMKLTQHGLYRGETVLLESFDEKRIFDLLGEEYVGPEDRNSIIKKRQKI